MRRFSVQPLVKYLTQKKIVDSSFKAKVLLIKKFGLFLSILAQKLSERMTKSYIELESSYFWAQLIIHQLLFLCFSLPLSFYPPLSVFVCFLSYPSVSLRQCNMAVLHVTLIRMPFPETSIANKNDRHNKACSRSTISCFVLPNTKNYLAVEKRYSFARRRGRWTRPSMAQKCPCLFSLRLMLKSWRAHSCFGPLSIEQCMLSVGRSMGSLSLPALALLMGYSM